MDVSGGKNKQKMVVMCGRPGAPSTGISTLTRDRVLEAVRGCEDCTQLAGKRTCCDRCSEQLMGIMNPVPLRLPGHDPATCAPPAHAAPRHE
jgi:hypothetical protein